jgi:SPP1 family predicted phage head-tail adaptor
MVRSGRLRHRVQLQSRDTATVDAAGQVTGGWSTFRTCYAEVMGTGGAEKFRGQQVSATATHLVQIRYPAAGTFPTPEHRVVFDSRNLNIETVKRDEMHQQVVWLQCREDL